MPSQIRPIRVVFLTFYFEAWDSLAGIHAAMSADPRFDVAVVATGRKLTGDANFSDGSAASTYLKSIGVKHEVDEDLSSLWDSGPDYIFVNYPWQRNYPHKYRPDNLARVGRIVYVPYFSLPMTNEPADGDRVGTHLYTQRMHQLASLTFVSDSTLREAYPLSARERVHFVGSPKLDALFASASEVEVQNRSRLRIVWAPHHTYSPHWLNFGNFAEVHEAMLKWARSHPKVDVVLRPHPYLFGTLVDRQVMSAGQLESWREAWNALPNTSIDSESSSVELFLNCDLLLTDGISYLAEYPVIVGKPVLFLERDGHWKLTAVGEIAAAASVRLPLMDGDSAIDQLAGFLDLMPDRSRAISELRNTVLPEPGAVAARILEVVAAHFVSGVDGTAPELIDPDSITEVPWELQPGREPLD